MILKTEHNVKKTEYKYFRIQYRDLLFKLPFKQLLYLIYAV